MPSDYKLSVFINCPFDPAYRRKLFRAIIFTVHDCGFIARSALEISDTSQVRVTKIFKIISECRVGIHDISRTELDAKTKLPRFNMPLELGMFLGAKEYGPRKQRKKVCLVLDRTEYRYQKFCSDIAGQDIGAHGRSISRTINVVRDFLNNLTDEQVPGAKIICRRYRNFTARLPAFCAELGVSKDDLTFRDYTVFVERWLRQHARPA